jgi:hypothetical protein
MAFVSDANLARFKANLDELFISKSNLGDGLKIKDGKLVTTEIDWESVANKPSFLTATDVTNATITAIEKANLVSQDDLAAAINSVYSYKGSVDTYEDLPEVDVKNGDVYNVLSDGMNYAAIISEDDALAWDALGATFDLTDYVKKSEIAAMSEDDIDKLFE